MSTSAKPPVKASRRVAAQVEGGGGAVALPLEHVVPAHLLDGGEIVILAIKPSLWYIPMSAFRWIASGVLMAFAARLPWVSPHIAGWLNFIAFWAIVVRLGWAILQWATRLYVLTNRRVMRLRGVFNVELFQCALTRIQAVHLTASLPERLVRTGTITIQTAGALGAAGGSATWRVIARPLDVHQKLSEAIHRAGSRGGNGL